jgi:hypothetical protein
MRRREFQQACNGSLIIRYDRKFSDVICLLRSTAHAQSQVDHDISQHWTRTFVRCIDL